MSALESNWMLSGNVQPRKLGKASIKAKQQHIKAKTAYGHVVQEMKLPTDKLPKWQYCNIMAFLRHLASVSVPFFNVIQALTNAASAAVLKLIIYIYIDIYIYI